MYCRNCGLVMNDTDMVCSKCITKKSEGTIFCQNCGFHTTTKTEFCLNCGAKQNTIVPQKIINDRIAELQKQEKKTRKVKKILSFVLIGSAITAFLLVLILELRPQPSNIPAPFYIFTLAFGEGYIYQPRDFFHYADSDVQAYWLQGRDIFSYIVISLIVFIGTFIDLLVEKIKYRTILKALKEAKNVL